jgi:hypothetical protein
LAPGFIKDEGAKDFDLGPSFLQRFHQHEGRFILWAGVDELHLLGFQVKMTEELKYIGRAGGGVNQTQSSLIFQQMMARSQNVFQRGQDFVAGQGFLL